MHIFTPPDGLHGVIDYARPDAPFVTSVEHRFVNSVTDVVVPAGFRTDFASVPWFFRRLFPKLGRYARAAMFHDIIYRDASATRAQADAIFLAIMTHDGVPWWPRVPLYLAVRYFGWIPWQRRHGRKRAWPLWRRVPEEVYVLALVAVVVFMLWLGGVL